MAKYIIFDSLFPVIFSDCQTHAEIARSSNLPVTSAGHFYTREGQNKISCFGKSISPGVASKGKDDEIILEKLFNE